MVQAKNAPLPQLNLQVAAGYSGLNAWGPDISNYTSSLANNIPGISGSTSLTYSWPVGNNTARGIFLQAASAYRRSEIASEDLARTINSTVAQDIINLRQSALALDKFYESVSRLPEGRRK